MGSLADMVLSALMVLAAVAFLVWRLRTKRAAPSCGVSPAQQPQVIVGARLARGLEKVNRHAR